MTVDSADVRYGRALEGATISAYAGERAAEVIIDLLESGEWRGVGGGFEDPSAFVRSVPFWQLSAPERLRLAYERAAVDAGASKRAIGDSAGVSDWTVRNDERNGFEPARDLAPEADEDEAEEPEPARDLAPEAGDELEDVPLWDEDAEVEPDEPSSSSAQEPASQLVEPDPLSPAEPGWHRLGEHLLYCGDSTDEEFVAACAGAAFAFADPPYNAGKADWDEGFVWRHDYLTDEAAIVAVTPGIAALAGFLAQTRMPYRWSMAAEITNGMTAGALRFGNWICVTLFAHGSIYRKSKDHIRIPAATGDDAGGTHASRKPLRLLTSLIELFTTKGDLVIDPFLGSGTTLMAAERTGRRCVGAEVDPMHCAEIIERYWKDKA